MKRIYLILFAYLVACTPSEVPLPESLFVEEINLVFVGEGETYMNRVWTTADQTPVITFPAAAQSWLSATMEDKHLKLVVQPNLAILPRSTVVTVTTPERSQAVQVFQHGSPIRELFTTGCRTSSSQNGHPWSEIFDPNPAAHWHTAWSDPGPDRAGQTHWITFDFP